MNARTTLFIVTAALALLLLTPATLRAGEEDSEDSAAARLFRDAWWAETGAGDLERALDGYQKAEAAEGSEALRAKALYRSAIVLERMGRTPDAVKALEKLSKQYAGQKALLGEARKRLEEWTANDLRESFSEWYQRYKYSPAFQAKVVDLVLKLGSPDKRIQFAAKSELLNIGEPALPALREHVRRRNETLRNNCVDVLFDLGALPRTSALLASWHWLSDYGNWMVVLGASDEEREDLRRDLDGKEGAIADLLRASQAGGDGLVGVVEQDDPSVVKYARQILWAACRYGDAHGIRRRVFGWLERPTLSSQLRQVVVAQVVSALNSSKRDSREVELFGDAVIEWLESTDTGIRDMALGVLRRGPLRSPDEWRHIARLILDNADRDERHSAWGRALMKLVNRAPADDLHLAVEAVLRVGRGCPIQAVADSDDVRGGNGAWVLEQVIERLTGTHAKSAIYFWTNVRGSDPARLEKALEWLTSARSVEVRTYCASIAAEHMDGPPGRLLSLLKTDAIRKEMSDNLFKALRRNSRLEDLPWTQADLDVLLRTLIAKRPPGNPSFVLRHGGFTQQGFSLFGSSQHNVLFRLFLDERLRPMVFEAVARAPQTFGKCLWSTLPKHWIEARENAAYALTFLEKHWPAWTESQRLAGITAFCDSRVCKDEEAKGVVLRRHLEVRPLTAKLRDHLLNYIGEPTLDDLRAAFDFSSPTGVDAVVAWVHHVRRDEESYKAFLPALRKGAPNALAVGKHFQYYPQEFRKNLIDRLLAHGGAETGRLAVAMLEKRSNLDEMPQWLAALRHPSMWQRLAAAKKLGHLYDESTVKALARAVDDPSPEVRDAVLAALERIKDTEEKKEYWRKFAEEKK